MLSSPCQPAVNSGAARLLCCRKIQLCRVDLSQSTTSRHLKRAAPKSKCFSSSLRSLREGKIGHWHLIVKAEYIKIRGHPSPGQIKAYLLRLDRPHTESVGSCSLVDSRGLSRQKGKCEISKRFALQSGHCVV